MGVPNAAALIEEAKALKDAYTASQATVRRLEGEVRELKAHIKMQSDVRAGCQWEYNKVADERDVLKSENDSLRAEIEAYKIGSSLGM